MNISNINNSYPLSANLVNLLSSDNTRFSVAGIDNETADSFSGILSGALQSAARADQTDKASALQLLTGQSDDLSGLLLDAQKAELSLNLALQIRNKVIDAYNEIMRMQV